MYNRAQIAFCALCSVQGFFTTCVDAKTNSSYYKYINSIIIHITYNYIYITLHAMLCTYLPNLSQFCKISEKNADVEI